MSLCFHEGLWYIFLRLGKGDDILCSTLNSIPQTIMRKTNNCIHNSKPPYTHSLFLVVISTRGIKHRKNNPPQKKIQGKVKKTKQNKTKTWVVMWRVQGRVGQVVFVSVVGRGRSGRDEAVRGRGWQPLYKCRRAEVLK